MISKQHGPTPASTRARGAAVEDAALERLQQAGLKLVQRNYRTPHRGGGEIDLIMQTHDGTLVFVEVRQRRDARQGGAAASVGPVKQRRIAFAARWFLQRYSSPPPCRFDVMAQDNGHWSWIRAAYDGPAW